MMDNYRYFNRDISWLSFNYRVLLEAADKNLDLYERLNFISIYSSNLEEFYKIRVADHKAVASGAESDEFTSEEAYRIIQSITNIVNSQMEERVRIFEKEILPALREKNIIFYQSCKEILPSQCGFIEKFFKEEIFPFLQPVPLKKGMLKNFIRDRRQYLAICMIDKKTKAEEHYIMKLPFTSVPRFIELPQIEDKHYIMYIEDIVKANLNWMFPGYDIKYSYCCKISRDADIYVDDASSSTVIVEQLKKKVKKRKIGAVCRFVYDRNMPNELLEFLADVLDISKDDFVPGDKHLNLEDLSKLPNPFKAQTISKKPVPMKLNCLDKKDSIFHYVAKRDLLLHVPYYSFEHFIHFLYEAVHDPTCCEIMITQYRVAENSEVINTLIAAAQNGKQVTVFVEVKARFDEENNMETAEMMKRSGINIIYSIPGLKVHAKVALVLRKDKSGVPIRSFAFINTGNFNESTATVYADTGLFTCNKEIVDDLHNLFLLLQQKIDNPEFKRLLVARYNLIPELKRLIDHEINEVQNGRKGYIILKMNAIQDPQMINELYRASEAGVKIDLIIRGICCLIPNQSYSKNISITRIVDSFLEHTRIWYFYHSGKEKFFLGSPDWMKRNLYRRIEAVTPILDSRMKQELKTMLSIQLNDNVKAVWVDENLNNIFKENEDNEAVRSQYDFYRYLKEKNDIL